MNKNKRMEICRGDITKLKVDAIVNAANPSLLGGGGVDGAIHLAGGHEILDACKKIVSQQGGCKTGEAVITTAGKLPAQYVIHTVGPVWAGGKNQEEMKLANCYRNSLLMAVSYRCKTIAFPGISTGAYGFPKPLAAKIAVSTVKDFLLQDASLDKVILVCFDQENFNLTQRELEFSLQPI